MPTEHYAGAGKRLGKKRVKPFPVRVIVLVAFMMDGIDYLKAFSGG